MGSPISVAEARARVLAACRPLAAESVPVGAAAGRVLAEDVVAAAPVPPFASSAMDGFALPPGPAGRRLRLVGESRAGRPSGVTPGAGEAIRISTGAALPDGDLAVLRVEDAREAGGEVEVLVDVPPGRDVRGAGEDVPAGAPLLRPGTRLGPVEAGVAVIGGRATVSVRRRPRVVVLATGDELRPPGAPLGPGEIHESNSVVLAAAAAAAGAEVRRSGRVPDTLERTREALGAALEEADVLLVSGGVSVGPHDHVKPALAALGVEERFWRIALRPGGPTWFGVRDGVLVFGLPGNPVSSFVTFTLLARPALLALQGAPVDVEVVEARFAAALPRRSGRDEYVRVRLEDGVATPTGAQGSHRLTSLLGADGLARVPAGDGALEAGTTVEVVRL